MKAVILAGGKGTRLANITQDIPKPMVPVGGIPVLEHQVRLLARYGIKNIIAITGHLSEVIEEYFGDGSRWNTHISYYREEQPLGTVGGLKEIEHLLTEDFIVLYGDVMIDMNLKRFIDFHTNNKSDITLALHPNDHPYDSDLAEIDKAGRVIAVHPKPHEAGRYYRNLVNAAAYIMSPMILRHLEKGKKADFGKDIFPVIYKQVNMYGYNTAEYMKDMGTPGRLEQVDKDYRSGKIERLNNEHKRRAIFLDRDGVLNEENGLIYKPEDLQLIHGTAEAIKKINKSEYLAVVVTNQSVIARNLCTVEELENIHKKMETELGDAHAKLDAIYYCPHHPDKGYEGENVAYKIDCECRKPKPGMLLDAARDFNIDLEHSYLIGDSGRDIKAAHAAGVTSIAVRTGNGLKDSSVNPHYFFENLSEAVDFILNNPFGPYADTVLDAYKEHKDKKPFVVLVAGNTRSGKSTFTKYLNDRFEAVGASVCNISLDNWIVPKSLRQPHFNVYDRFQMDKMEKDMERALGGETVTLAGYDPKSHDLPKESTLISFQNEDVVIIEGVVALSSAYLREKAGIKIFIDLPEYERKARLHKFYTWKGLPEADIEEQYHSRKKDEYDLIKGDEKFADIKINTIFENTAIKV